MHLYKFPPKIFELTQSAHAKETRDVREVSRKKPGQQIEIYKWRVYDSLHTIGCTMMLYQMSLHIPIARSSDDLPPPCRIATSWDADVETCRTCRFWDEPGAQTDSATGTRHVRCTRLSTPQKPVYTYPDNFCERYKENTIGRITEPHARAHYRITEGDDNETR